MLAMTVHTGECWSCLMLSTHSSHVLFSCSQVRGQSQRVRETGPGCLRDGGCSPGRGRVPGGPGQYVSVWRKTVREGRWGTYGKDGVWATSC